MGVFNIIIFIVYAILMLFSIGLMVKLWKMTDVVSAIKNSLEDIKKKL